MGRCGGVLKEGNSKSLEVFLHFTILLSQAYPDASDEDDLVEIEDIEPYAAPGSILNRPTQPTTPGQTHTGDVSRTKSVNPYDNVTDSPDEPDEERRYLNVEEMREHERMSSCKCFLLATVKEILILLC